MDHAAPMLASFVILLTACSPSASIVQTAIAQTQAIQVPQRFDSPTEIYLAYVTPAHFGGIGPILVPASDDILLEFRPDDQSIRVAFVTSLTLFIRIVDPTVQSRSTLDFSLYVPSDGGWGINGGKNSIQYGAQEIRIKYPDSYVSANGTVRIDIRNFGKKDVTIERLSMTMAFRDARGQDFVINPRP